MIWLRQYFHVNEVEDIDDDDEMLGGDDDEVLGDERGTDQLYKNKIPEHHLHRPGRSKQEPPCNKQS